MVSNPVNSGAEKQSSPGWGPGRSGNWRVDKRAVPPGSCCLDESAPAALGLEACPPLSIQVPGEAGGTHAPPGEAAAEGEGVICKDDLASPLEKQGEGSGSAQEAWCAPLALPISEHAQLLPTAQCRLPRHLIRLVFPPAILEGFPFCQSSSGSWNSLPATLPHTAAFGPDLIKTVPYPDGFSENKV